MSFLNWSELSRAILHWAAKTAIPEFQPLFIQLSCLAHCQGLLQSTACTTPHTQTPGIFQYNIKNITSHISEYGFECFIDFCSVDLDQADRPHKETDYYLSMRNNWKQRNDKFLTYTLTINLSKSYIYKGVWILLKTSLYFFLNSVNW